MEGSGHNCDVIVRCISAVGLGKLMKIIFSPSALILSIKKLMNVVNVL